MAVALWIKWRLSAEFWRSGDGFWMVGRVCGGLRKEIAVGWILDQKIWQVFVVDEAVCGEGEGWGSSGLGR